MFDFEKLIVYQKAKAFHAATRSFLKNTKLDRTTADQLNRASLSIVLNIAEGSGRFSKPDRKNFFTVSRSSVFECIALFEIIFEEDLLAEEDFLAFYGQGEELSKMLLAMINNLSK